MIKLNLMRFDDITVEIAPKVDDSDLLKMLKDLAANKQELIALGQEFGLFAQQLERTKAKWSKNFQSMQKEISETRNKMKSPLGSAKEAQNQLKPMKDMELGSLGPSNVEGVKSKLEGILTVIENIKNQGSNVNLTGLTDSLKTLGIFDTLPASMQGTLSALAKMDNLAKNDDKSVSALVKVLNQSITTLDGVSNAHKNNKNATEDDKNATKDYKEMTDALNKSIIGITTVFNVFRNALRRVSSTITKVVKDSSDYVESINLFNMALGEYAKSLEEWASTISEKLYLDPSEVYQYTGSFYNLAKGLGVAGENAAFMAKNLTQLTYDMTSYLNLRPDVAYNKLLSAMSGQTKAVTNVGIAVQRASLEELAHAMGIEKSVTEMTQAEKTYLRYIQIMKSTQQMQGDLGRTIITPTNAMRLFETQIKLTGRAIGQVLTPIIMKTLPYLIALTQLLQEAAQRLAAMLGFNLKDYEVDASGVSNLFSDIADSADEATDSTGKLNRTLAKFDDLNVVESASSGKGGVDVSEADFSKYLRGYDMLKDYTAQMAKQIEEAKKNLSGLFNVIKGIAVTLGTIFAIKKIVDFVKWTKNLVSWVKKLWKGWEAVEGVTKGFKGIGTILGEWITKIGGIKALLGGLTLTIAGIVGYLKGFTGLREDIKGWNTDFYGASEGATQLRTHLVELAGGFSAAAVGAGVLFGPVGGLIVGAVGFTAALATTILEAKKAIAEMEYQQALLLTEFANTGPTLDQVNEAFKMTFGAFSDYLSDTQALMDEVDKSKETLDDAAKAFDNLAFHIAFGDYKGNIEGAYEAIEENLESLNNATTTHYTNLKKFQLEQIEQLGKDGAMTKETYEKKKKAIEEYYDMLTGRSAQYNSQFAALLKDLESGTITQDQYNQKLAELNTKYADVATATDGATYSFESYTKALTEGVNIAGQTAEQIQTSVGDLTAEYEKQRNAIETNYEVQRKSNTEELAAARDKLKTYQEGSEEYTKTLTHIQELENTQKTLYANHQADLLKLQSTYATTMESIYNTMEKAGISTKEKFKDVADDIKNKQAEAFTYISDHLSDYKKINTESGVQIGYAIGDGMAVGWVNGEKKIFEKVDKTNDNIQWEIKDAFKIHSPSKVTQEYGENITEGLANGIADQRVMRKVDEACRSLVDSVTRSLGRLQTNTKLEINADIGSSFNNVLNKLDTFCSNWRDAINQLAKNMTTTMNGIKIDGSGKVSYTTMPKVNVRKFENGGYPKSADMFFMNENGRAEYMTSIGNKTAVVNQDQMTTALADTITRALGSMSTGDKGDTIVYIGNDKVYQGQGEYQSRETDRYGTTYVKI